MTPCVGYINWLESHHADILDMWVLLMSYLRFCFFFRFRYSCTLVYMLCTCLKNRMEDRRKSGDDRSPLKVFLFFIVFSAFVVITYSSSLE